MNPEIFSLCLHRRAPFRFVGFIRTMDAAAAQVEGGTTGGRVDGRTDSWGRTDLSHLLAADAAIEVIQAVDTTARFF
jgi:hypothetical protein